MDGILGISPSTRTIGMVVFTHGSLADWQIKSFLGKWSEQKLGVILSTINHWIERFEIKTVVCKVYDKQGLRKEVITGIHRLCRRKRIAFICYSFSDIVKATVQSKKLATKRGIMEFLIKKYPELMIEFSQEIKNLNPYYIKLFEAIGAVEVFLQSSAVV
jgi:hypothetical protein